MEVDRGASKLRNKMKRETKRNETEGVPSLVPRPSPAPVFDHLQYAKTEPEGLVNLTT